MDDFNDISITEGAEAVKEQINNAKAIPYVPEGFAVNDKGVFKVDDKGENLICSPLYIEALTRDDNQNGWGKRLTWHDQDGTQHEFALPNTMLAGDGTEYRRILLDRGLVISSGRPAQNALHDYIMSANPPARMKSTNKPGWNGDCYVGVDGSIYGTPKERTVLQISGALPKLSREGNLESWQQNVAQYACGNSRLALAICISLAGPLLRFANEGSGGFHIVGASSSGKTTALQIGASVWGAAMRNWNTTSNAAESWARFANDGFLPIDELSQVDAKSADQMAYLLGNGHTRGRATRDGIARETSSFSLLFLSTGEIALADKLREDGRSAKAGQMVRMTDIPADAEKGMQLFEDLHDFSSAGELARFLKRASDEHQGHAAPVWIEELTKIGIVELNAAIPALMRHWTKTYIPAGANGQVLRVANRFALAAVAGELASSLGILPWPDTEASNAAAKCFYDWLRTRGGTGSHEVREGIRAIIAFIERHGNSRFQTMGKDESDASVIHNRAGFKKRKGDEQWYFVLQETMREEILDGSQNEKTIIQAAIEAGLIVPDHERKSTCSINLPGLGKKRVYCIVPSRYKGGL